MSPRTFVSLGALLGAVCSSQVIATPARAESLAPSAASAAPDVVLLKNGGMLRGTIVELVPDQTVSLLLPTGETRTYSMEEVAFAGPAQAAPWNRPSESPAPTAPEEKKPESEKPEPFITVHAEKARLNVTSKEPNLTVHLKSGTATTSVNLTRTIRSDAYTPICTAPCEASLPVGTHELGVSAPGDSVTAVEKPVEITGPGTLEASYASKAGARVGGVIIMLAGGGAGTALILSGDADSYSSSNLHAGIAVVAGSALVGTLLLGTSDTATVTFIPTVATPASDPSSPARDMQSASVFDTRGLTVVGTF